MWPWSSAPAERIPTRLPFATVLREELEAIWGQVPSIDVLPGEVAALHVHAPESEAALNAIIHHRRNDEQLSAICLSGGGIRSATFSLGVLQGLAAHGVLDQFSYLSTVSGGGYLGSWLTAWIHRKAREYQRDDSSRHLAGRAAVDPPDARSDDGQRELPRATPLSSESIGASGADGARSRESAREPAAKAEAQPGLGQKIEEMGKALADRMQQPKKPAMGQPSDEQVKRAIARIADELAGRHLGLSDSPAHDFRIEPGNQGVVAEAPAIVQLRRFSNYLAPQAGFLSADSWVLVATVLRNIILNWLVLIPVLMGALAVPRFLAAAVFAWPRRIASPIVSDPAVFAGWLPIATGFCLCAVTIGFVSWKRVLVLRRPTPNASPDRVKSSERAGQRQVVIWGVIPLCAAAFALSIGWAWVHLRLADDSLGRGMGAMVAFGVLVMLAGWLGYFVYSLSHDREIDHELLPRGWVGYGSELGLYMACGGIGGFILRLAAHPFDGASLQASPLHSLVYATTAPPIFVLSFLLAATIFVGLASRKMSEMDREWWSRFGAWALIMSTTWLVLSSVVLLAPHWLAGTLLAPLAAALTAGSGAVTIFAGLSRNTVFKAVAQTAFPGHEAAKGKSTGGTTPWMALLLKVALPTFVTLFAITLSLLTDLFVAVTYARPGVEWSGLVHEYLYGNGHLNLSVARINMLWAIGLIVFGAGMSACVSVNKFSLHAMYRNRLIRAYLGASRGMARTPDLFIGFDPKDDLPLCATKSAGGHGRPLLHVINIALNLVGGDELAWQERKAESMTATALHAGTPRLGYRRANEYGGVSIKTGDEEGHALTLGTAIGISGAAASPNMGYHSSPMLTFLMTLFNARLGWWLGNPGPAGDTTCSLDSPRSSLRPLFAEAFGQTDERNPYVYLSDGGHFENLGLYEMVRRRCHFIFVVDAGADPGCEFEDLSGAVGKIRSDLGIPIEFPDVPDRSIFARSSESARNAKGKMVMTGRIRYSAVDAVVDPATGMTDERAAQYDGTLVYIKPAYYGNAEPMDVVHYATGHESFPHETTADQFFSESQFESYRAMGMLAIRQVCGTLDAGLGPKHHTLVQFQRRIDEYLKPTKAAVEG